MGLRLDAGSLGRLVLWALVVSTFGAALVRPLGKPSTEESTFRLQAESLAFDLDLRYGETDVERFRAHGWDEWARVGLGVRPPGLDVFQRPFPYAVLLMPFVVLAPERGPLILNAILLAIAAWFAVRFLERLIGDSASWLVAALIFGSAVFATVFSAQPDTLLIAATVVALTLAERQPLAAGGLPDLHPGGRATRSASMRWLAVGGLLGIVVIHHPLYLLMTVVVFLRVPRSERASAAPLIVLGLIMVLLVSWWAGGLYSDLGPAERLVRAADSLEEIHGRGASPLTGAGKRFTWPLRLEPGLIGWNALYFLVGRHVGLLPYALPLLAVLSLATGSGRLRQVAPMAALAVAGFLLLFPFNFFGGPAVGNRWFLPLFAALWTTPGRPLRAGIGATVLLLGSLLLWPLWLGESPVESLPAGPVFARLPFETTQRAVPVNAEVVAKNLRVLAASGAIAPSRGELPLLLERGRRGQLMVVSQTPLAALELEFGAEAKEEPVVGGGGRLGRTTFRPDGGVSYEVILEGHERRHSTWWSQEIQRARLIWVQMPQTGTDRLPFGVSVPQHRGIRK